MLASSQQRKRDLTEKRRADVAALLSAGSSQQEIARALGVSPTTIGKDILRLRERWRHEQIEDIEQALLLDLQRVNRLMKVYLPQALQRDVQAADRVIKLLEYRARVLGYETLHIDLTSNGMTVGGPTIIEIVRDERTIDIEAILRGDDSQLLGADRKGRAAQLPSGAGAGLEE